MLKLISVQERGDHKKEYVYMLAEAACDIGKYLLCDTTYVKEGSVSNKLRNTFWLPDKLVARGDRVLVRTCEGANTEYANDIGTKTHVVYWGLGRAVWNNSGDAAVLMNIHSWQHVKA